MFIQKNYNYMNLMKGSINELISLVEDYSANIVGIVSIVDRNDKKRSGNKLIFIVLEKIGQAKIKTDIDESKIAKAIQSMV